MSDKPILFSAPMVCALLDGRKTQTRRTLKPKKDACLLTGGWTDDYVLDAGNQEWRERYYPWRVGDRLYVRETFSFDHSWAGTKPREVIPAAPVHYWADGNPTRGDWTKPIPAIHQPRWVSRITLTVTDVRVQRLHAISEEDSQAEGAYLDDSPCDHSRVTCEEIGCLGQTHKAGFCNIWSLINGTPSWLANPWVVAVTFSVEKGNINEVGEQGLA